jgi:hypothetical protein
MPFHPKEATVAQPVGRPATGLLLLQWCEDRSRLQHDASGLSKVLQPGHENSFSKPLGLLVLRTALGILTTLAAHPCLRKGRTDTFRSRDWKGR